MHAKVIVGFDATAEACDALAFGRLVAERHDAELIVAAVYPGRDRGIYRIPA